MIETIERVRLGFVATVTPGGRPSLSPKGTFVVLDDKTVAFAEIRSPQTLTNLGHHPEVEVNFVDGFTRKGLRLRGQTSIIRKDTADWGAHLPQFQTLWPTLVERMNLIVKISVDEVKPLSTPPYDDGVTEEEMIALYKDKYARMYP